MKKIIIIIWLENKGTKGYKRLFLNWVMVEIIFIFYNYLKILIKQL